MRPSQEARALRPFLLAAMAIAASDRIMPAAEKHGEHV
jgi:hypothetical protein